MNKYILSEQRTMGKKQFLKQIQSLEGLIRKHKEKIEKERTKPIPDANLIQYWEREIKVFINEVEKSRKRLNRGR